MSRYAVRVGAGAGWFALAGLLIGLVILPAAIAGQPPTTSSSATEIRDYFSHPELGILNGYVTGFVAIGFVAFGLGLRSALATGTDRDRFFADLGVALLVIAMGLNVISGALVAAGVDATARGTSDLTQLLAFHNVTFDGLGDVVEGGWIGAFSIAMLGGAMPRWIGWFGVALGVAHIGKALGPFIALPDAIDAVFGVVIALWLLATVVALTRLARQPAANGMAVRA